MPPRWKTCTRAVDRNLGEALGQEFVRRTFSAEMKAKTQRMTEQIETAMGEEIAGLDWMTPATKDAALKKLSQITVKIAYPDTFRDYSALTIKDGDLYGDVVRARQFEYNRDLARLNKPVDRSEWGMTPQTVNAYYNPTMNEIVFPAGILQPPFFDQKADDAVNYGAIGAVIGHELTHGFDDQGRKIDAGGELRDWWTAEDAASFKSRAARLSAV